MLLSFFKVVIFLEEIKKYKKKIEELEQKVSKKEEQRNKIRTILNQIALGEMEHSTGISYIRMYLDKY